MDVYSIGSLIGMSIVLLLIILDKILVKNSGFRRNN